jgi:Txe/YoeB family toxin of toxin-antitoxin system
MKYNVTFSKKAIKDLEKLKAYGLVDKLKKMIEILEKNPFEPPYEKLQGDLNGVYSRRLNIQHRLVYEIHNKEKIVRILKIWGHYE